MGFRLFTVAFVWFVLFGCVGAIAGAWAWWVAVLVVGVVGRGFLCPFWVLRCGIVI